MAGQQSLTVVNAFVAAKKALSNGHHDRHYLDIVNNFY